MKQSESAEKKFYKWRAKFADSKTNRQTFMFQLDWSDPDDLALIEIIAILKAEERFSAIIKQALRIEGQKIDGTYEDRDCSDNDKLDSLQDKLNEVLESLQNPVPAGLIPQNTIAMRPVTGSPTQMLNVPQFAINDDDDGLELDVTIDESASITVTDNFLASLMKLQAKK